MSTKNASELLRAHATYDWQIEWHVIVDHASEREIVMWDGMRDCEDCVTSRFRAQEVKGW